MKKLSKYLIALAIISFLALPALVQPVLATTTGTNATFGIDIVETGLGTDSLKTGDPRVIAGRIINFALTFLGLIAVAIILYGGFKWMTAAGNEDQVGEAKKLLGAGVIGLLIILAAWALSTFLIAQIYAAVGDGH